MSEGRREALKRLSLSVRAKGIGAWLLGIQALVLAGASPVRAQVAAAPGGCIRVEAFVRSGSPQCDRAIAYLQRLAETRPGLKIDVRDIAQEPAALERLRGLARQFGQKEALVPTILAAGRVVVGFKDDATSGPQVEELLTIHMFTRDGCPRCASALPFLGSLPARYPGLRVVTHEVTRDPNALPYLQQLATWYGVQGASVPAFFAGGRLFVGYSSYEITGRQIEAHLDALTAPCAIPPQVPSSFIPPARLRRSALPEPASWRPATVLAVLLLAPLPRAEDPPPRASTDQNPDQSGGSNPPASSSGAPLGLPAEASLPREAPLPAESPLPGEALLPGEGPSFNTPGSPGGVLLPVPARQPAPDTVEVPWLGKLDVRRLGMPAFTLLIGLVDGFNPCAMWVLIFLLSVLVGLNDRRKVILIAGTFVVVSGLAYFAFMAAWLNVFLLVGYARPAQVALGLLAVLVGVVHVKDFFAFKRGLSFSIPESAKPSIYKRVREIVTAKSLVVALSGAIVLAVLVNTVELLCTAGLPALYTQVLTYQQYPVWKNYAYLGLYILAYMFDDAMMLTIVVATLSRRRLQEKEGRWLKLVSGLVILALGLVMLFQPGWLEAI